MDCARYLHPIPATVAVSSMLRRLAARYGEILADEWDIALEDSVRRVVTSMPQCHLGLAPVSWSCAGVRGVSQVSFMLIPSTAGVPRGS